MARRAMERPEVNKHKSLPRGIFFRGGKYWINFYDAQGNRRREPAGPELSDAEDLLAVKKAEKAKGITDQKVGRQKPKAAMTLKEVIQHYSAERLAKVAALGEEQRYQEYWASVSFAGKPINEITRSDISAWATSRLTDISPITGKPVKPGTVRRALNVLKAILNLAITDGILRPRPENEVAPEDRGHINPVIAYMKPRKVGREAIPKANDERKRYLTEEEEVRLKEVMRWQDYELVEFALETGMRQHEIFELRRDSVDLENRVLHVPKSKDGEARAVLLTERAAVILREALSSHDHPWVWPTQNNLTGEYTHRNAGLWMKKRFRPALQEAGIENLTFHDLRHTFASRLVRAGVPIQRVSKLLGHSTIRMTERYTHLREDELREALRSLQKPATISEKPVPKPTKLLGKLAQKQPHRRSLLRSTLSAATF